MSPGWQESASQIASSVEKRIARALPVLRIERLASVIPTLSARSVSVIRRSCSTSSSLTTMAMSDGPFEVVAHAGAFRKDAGQDEREQHAEPAADGKAGVQINRMRGSRNRLRDGADGNAEQLKRQHRFRYRLQALRVRRHERVPGANRIDDGHQALEHGIVQDDDDEAERGRGAQAPDQPIGVKRGGEVERTDDPVPVWHDNEQRQDGG